MGSVWSTKNKHLKIFHPFTLLFKESNMNYEYDKTKKTQKSSLILYFSILFYSLFILIFFLVTTENTFEIIVGTTCFVICLIGLFLFFISFCKFRCIKIKNVRFFQLILLTVVYVVFTFLNRVLCNNLKRGKSTSKDKFFFEIIFIDIEIIFKFLWALLDVNEFIFLFFGNSFNLIIIFSYFDTNLSLYILIAFTLSLIVIIQTILSYYLTKIQKESHVVQKLQVDLEKYADAFNIGYFSLNNSYDFNSKNKQTTQENESVLYKSKYFDQDIFRKIFPEKRNLISLLGDLEEMNKEILVFDKTPEISKNPDELDSHGTNSINFSEHKNTLNWEKKDENVNYINSQLLKDNHGLSSWYKHNISGSEFPLMSLKKESYLNSSNKNSCNKNIEESSYRQEKKSLFHRKNKMEKNIIDVNEIINNTTQKEEASIIVNSENSIVENQDDGKALIACLHSYVLKNIEKSKNFVYLGRKRININQKDQNFNDSVSDFLYFKILFRYNFSLKCFQFVFLDESKYQYDLIFKRFAQQISMYLHDFKNPLISLNEKIIELKEMFNNLHLQSKFDKATFEFDKDFINDFSFLSITTSDCIGMIKSYENFAKTIVDPKTVFELDLSSFKLQELINYLRDWMNLKISKGELKIDFEVIYVKPFPEDLIICTDKLKLKQILVNILSNSLKFTTRGSIKLTMSREKIDNKFYIKFVVEDTGIGMNELTVQSIFQPFFTRKTGIMNKDGCGLGLVISQKMSACLGKEIEVESTEFQGTKMWFYCEEKENPKKTITSSILFREREEMVNDNINNTVKNNSFSGVSEKGIEDELIDYPLSNQTVRRSSEYLLNIVNNKSQKRKPLSKVTTKKSSSKINLIPDDTLICNEMIAISPKQKPEFCISLSPSKLKSKRRSVTLKGKSQGSAFKNSFIFQNFETNISSFSNLLTKLEISLTFLSENNNLNVNFSPSILNNSTIITSKKPFFKTQNSFSKVPLFSTKSIGRKETKSTLGYSISEQQPIFNQHFKTFFKSGTKAFSILIVDDENLCQKSTNRIINSFGLRNITVEFLNDGYEFLIKFWNKEILDYDLIIMDNHMNLIDGTDVINLILFMKENNIGINCNFDYNILYRLWICSADTYSIQNKLFKKEIVNIVGKPVTRVEMEKILRKYGAIK